MTVTENTRIFNKGIQKLRIEEERLIKIRKLREGALEKIPIYKKNVPHFVSQKSRARTDRSMNSRN